MAAARHELPIHVMTAADAVAVLDELARYGVDACVGGGWGVDAAVGHQTRPHGDLDVWIRADSLDRAIAAFVAAGVDRVYPWGDERPWNFVLHDGGNRRVDLHLYEVDDEGRLDYGGIDGETFPTEALSGSGTIGQREVRCEAPEWSLRWHTGYPPRDHDRHDVELLCATFGLEPPTGFA